MNRKMFPLVLLCMFLLLSTAAFADAGRVSVAPLSDAFLEYQRSLLDKQGRGTAVSAANVPSPLDFSHLRGADYSSFLKTQSRGDSLPAKYDPRPSGVTSVKNQEPYNDCWAFSALGAMEASYIKTKNIALDLSEMHLVLSAFRSGTGFTNANNIANPLNNGGFDNLAVSTLARWDGPVLESYMGHGDFPANGIIPQYPSRLHLQGAFVLNLQFLTDPNAQQPTNAVRKELISRYGAISVGMYGSSISNAYNETHCSWNTAETKTPDHAVLIVGWDDSFSKDKFNVKPANDGAWLVKNSWGANWGDGGYFWLSYEDHSLLDGVAYVVEEPDNYKYNYGHDYLGWCSSVSYGVGGISWAGNVFTSIHDGEALNAVSFYTTAANTTYDIYIYTGLASGSSPRSGTKSYERIGVTEPLAGYHTVKLDKPVSLAKGSRFSVVMRMHTPDYKYPLAVEMPIKGYSDNAIIDWGESYFSENGVQWIDGKKIGELSAVSGDKVDLNACIRAFTDHTGSQGPSSSPAISSDGGGGGGCNTGAAYLFALAGFILLRRSGGKY